MTGLRERLTQDGILVSDGATGTFLQRAGLPSGMAPDRWNLENPDAIETMHRGYVDAGADLILTNTFGSNRPRLEKQGLADRMREVILVATHLAHRAAGDSTLVLGDMGPTGELMKPLGMLTYEGAVAMFAERIRIDEILQAGWMIAYAGVLSVGVAYTLQVVGQRRVDAARAGEDADR